MGVVVVGLPARIPKRTGEVSLGSAEGQSEPDYCRAGEGGHCGFGVVHADCEGGIFLAGLTGFSVT